MELLTANHVKEPVQVSETITEVMDQFEVISTSKPFIGANTIGATLYEINNFHIIPVFVKENEPAISQGEFVDAAMQAISRVYAGETILKPNIRLSHPIKGRIPEAKNKAAKDLLDHECTLYYERMAWVVEIPTISNEIEGCRLNLTIGGVKSYNLDSLMSNSSDQHFKVFVGFKNMVCTNMCVSSDGYIGSLKVKNIGMLYNAILSLLTEFNAVQMAQELQQFQQHTLSEQQFAQLIGRCRMYRHMPDNLKLNIPEISMGDSQINSVCKDYYSDNSFACNPDGSINLWRLYNLFTGANKSSYIDHFLDRSENAYAIVRELMYAIQNKSDCWFLN